MIELPIMETNLTTEEAARHYGSVAKLAESLGISTQAVYKWHGDVPAARAYQLQILTGGLLQARKSEKVRRA